MGTIAQYNLYKGISTALTIGSPLVVLACCSEFFVHQSETAISAAAAFAILISLLFTKDKIMENIKFTPAFVVSLVIFIFVLIVENLILTLKIVSLTSVITCLIDELTFKQWYKTIEITLPDEAATRKHFGFYFTTSKNIGV